MDRKEALKIVRENYPHFGTTEPWLDLEKALATLIPELAESEDERIRRWLCDYFSSIDKAWIHKDITCIDILRWLEKQKEQKPDSLTKYVYSKDDKKFIQDCANILVANDYATSAERLLSMFGQKPNIEICPHSIKSKSYKENGYPIENCDYGLEIAYDILEKTFGEVQGYQTDDGIREHRTAMKAVKDAMEEQKPTWSDEDKQWLSEVYFAIDHSMYSEDERQAMKKYIDSLRSQLKPAEWSEEDEEILKLLILNIGRYMYFGGMSSERILSFLKSLRPQQRQEWSEEEKEILDSILSHYVLIDKPIDANGIPKEKYISLIKSIRFDTYKNCNSHWKPSEEQMEALESAVKLYKDTHFEIHHKKIVSLYEQLKKLM